MLDIPVLISNVCPVKAASIAHQAEAATATHGQHQAKTAELMDFTQLANGGKDANICVGHRAGRCPACIGPPPAPAAGECARTRRHRDRRDGIAADGFCPMGVCPAAAQYQPVTEAHQRPAAFPGTTDQRPAGPRGPGFHARYFRDLDGNKLNACRMKMG